MITTPSDSTREIDVMVPRSIRSARRTVKLGAAPVRRREGVGRNDEPLHRLDVIEHELGVT